MTQREGDGKNKTRGIAFPARGAPEKVYKAKDSERVKEEEKGEGQSDALDQKKNLKKPCASNWGEGKR